MDELAERLTTCTCTGVLAQIAAELLTRCRHMTRQINDLEHQIRDRVRGLAPSLLKIPGCGVLSTAVVIGETAGAHRGVLRGQGCRVKRGVLCIVVSFQRNGSRTVLGA